MSMFNLLDQVKGDPITYRQLNCDDALFTEFNCDMQRPLQDLWSHENYFVHMLDGRKGWYSQAGEQLLLAGDTAFVRKGATLVQQYLDQPSCVILFFLSDPFICETVRSLGEQPRRSARTLPSVMPIHTSPVLHGFFQGMLPHFQGPNAARPELLQLKFRELLLAAVTDERNEDLRCFCCSLLDDPVKERVRRVMEDNCFYDMELGDLARLSGRSLAAFKRDVQELFGMPPGRWIRKRRLERAQDMLAHGDLQVSDIAFRCGFENLSHFSRSFKEEFGRSPALFRKATLDRAAQ